MRYLKDGQKDIVPVSAIQNFKAEAFDSKVDKNKKFKIKWSDGDFYEGSVMYVEGK